MIIQLKKFLDERLPREDLLHRDRALRALPQAPVRQQGRGGHRPGRARPGPGALPVRPPGAALRPPHPDRVAQAGHLRPGDAEDRDGACWAARSSAGSRPRKERSISIYGDKGLLVGNLMDQEVWFYENGDVGIDYSDNYYQNVIMGRVSEGKVIKFPIKQGGAPAQGAGVLLRSRPGRGAGLRSAVRQAGRAVLAGGAGLRPKRTEIVRFDSGRKVASWSMQQRRCIPRRSSARTCKIWNWVQVRENAEIGENTIISKGVYVDFGVKIGRNVKIQNNVSVYHGVTIEDGVFVGPHVCFTNDKRPARHQPRRQPEGRRRLGGGAHPDPVRALARRQLHDPARGDGRPLRHGRARGPS